jgi:hypothetical protein
MSAIGALMGNLTTYAVHLSPMQVSSLKKRAMNWGLMDKNDLFSQTIFEKIVLALILPEQAKGGLRLKHLRKQLHEANSNESGDNPGPDRVRVDERPWIELDARRQNERLREAGDYLQLGFAKAEAALNMRDESGELVSMCHSLGLALEYIMTGTYLSRTKLTV